MPFFQGGGGHGSVVNVRPPQRAAPPPRPFLANLGRALANVGGAVSHTTSAVAHHPTYSAPHHPFSFSGPRTDAQTSGPGYGSARANAFKNTPAYHAALLATATRQSPLLAALTKGTGASPFANLLSNLQKGDSTWDVKSAEKLLKTATGPMQSNMGPGYHLVPQTTFATRGVGNAVSDGIANLLVNKLGLSHAGHPPPAGMYDTVPNARTYAVPLAPVLKPGQIHGVEHGRGLRMNGLPDPQLYDNNIKNMVSLLDPGQHAIPDAIAHLAQQYNSSPQLQATPAFAQPVQAKQRLFADPSRPASFAAGGALQPGADAAKALHGTVTSLLKTVNSVGKHPTDTQVHAIRDLVALARTYPALKGAILSGGKGVGGKAAASFLGGPQASGAPAASVLQSVPSLKSLTVRGAPITSSQLAAANRIVQIGKQLHAPPTAIAGVLTDAIYESTLNPNDPGNPRYGGLLAGAVNDGTFAPGAAGADAQIRSAFQGGKGFQGGGAIGQAKAGNKDLLRMAEVISGSGTQHQSQSGSSSIPPEGARIAEALLRNRVPIQSAGSAASGLTVPGPNGPVSISSVGGGSSSAYTGPSGPPSGGVPSVSSGGSSSGGTVSSSTSGSSTSSSGQSQSSQQSVQDQLLAQFLSSSSPWDVGPKLPGFGGSSVSSMLGLNSTGSSPLFDHAFSGLQALAGTVKLKKKA